MTRSWIIPVVETTDNLEFFLAKESHPVKNIQEQDNNNRKNKYLNLNTKDILTTPKNKLKRKNNKIY